MARRVAPPNHDQPLPNDNCSRCGVEIEVGDPYLFWTPGFRSHYKVIRCMKPTCYPRPSERESSLMAEIMGAQESVEDSLSGGGQESSSDFEELRDQVKEALESVIDQYREADEAMGGTGSTASAERADELESSKDELEGLDFDERPERDELDGCPAAGIENEEGHVEHTDENVEGCEACDQIYDDAMDDWREEQSEKLSDAMSVF